VILFLLLLLLDIDVSQYSAIASQILSALDMSVSQSYIATFVGRLCYTHLLIHYNASICNLCMIILQLPGVASFSLQSTILCLLHQVIRRPTAWE